MDPVGSCTRQAYTTPHDIDILPDKPGYTVGNLGSHKHAHTVITGHDPCSDLGSNLPSLLMDQNATAAVQKSDVQQYKSGSELMRSSTNVHAPCRTSVHAHSVARDSIQQAAAR